MRGQTLVTAWTKNRTTAHFVGPHGYLFNRAVWNLSSESLCDAATVSFLRLRHLIVPPDQACQGWVVSSARIDGQWSWATWVGGEDARVRAIPAASLTPSLREEPALAQGSALIRGLAPQEGTVLRIDTARHALRVSGLGPEGAPARRHVLRPAGGSRPGLASVVGPHVGRWGDARDCRCVSRRAPERVVRAETCGATDQGYWDGGGAAAGSLWPSDAGFSALILLVPAESHNMYYVN